MLRVLPVILAMLLLAASSQKETPSGSAPREISIKKQPTKELPVPAEIMNILQEAGLSKVAAAGITGNALQESSWNPASEGMGGGGLWGFTVSPVSLADLQSFAGKRPWTDVRVQTEFLLEHLEIHDPLFRERLQATRSPEEAAELFCWEWERPYEPTANLERRQAGARLAFEKFSAK